MGKDDGGKDEWCYAGNCKCSLGSVVLGVYECVYDIVPAPCSYISITVLGFNGFVSTTTP